MDTSINSIGSFYKIVLFDQGDSLSAPRGVLEIRPEHTAYKIEGELFNQYPGMGQLELGLSIETLDGREMVLGTFKKGRGGQGKIVLKTRMPVQLDNCSKVFLNSKKRVRNKVHWSSLLSGFLNCPTNVKEKPGDYLWNSPTADFPLLLEKMMEKVEAITEKVSTLEKRRAGRLQQMPVKELPQQPSEKLQQVSTIKQVEPFRPPLGNYRWWQLG